MTQTVTSVILFNRLKGHRTRFLMMTFILILTGLSAQAAPTCQEIFAVGGATTKTSESPSFITKIEIGLAQFRNLLRAQRDALMKKGPDSLKELAKNWRSEWKQKLSVTVSNRMTHELMEKLLSPETRAIVLQGLDPKKVGFTRAIHERLWQLQKTGGLKDEDQITVRDPPPPQGVTPLNFTYYQPALVAQSEGATAKHQPRTRTYLLEINLSLLEVGVPVTGFLENGQPITIEKQTSVGENPIFKVSDELEPLNLAQAKKRFGSLLYLRAEHGQGFNLEIKTALTDLIESPQLPLMNGPHMVQKLDLKLTTQQVRELFSRKSAKQEQLERLAQELLERNDEAIKKDKAVMDLILANIEILRTAIESGKLQGNAVSPIEIIGATAYNRTAFQGRTAQKDSSGKTVFRPTFQYTVDRIQNVFFEEMYWPNGELKSPSEVLQSAKKYSSTTIDARHVELKMMAPDVQKHIGIKYDSALALPNFQIFDEAGIGAQLKWVADVFHRHLVQNSYLRRMNAENKHAGKFMYGLKKAEEAGLLDP